MATYEYRVQIYDKDSIMEASPAVPEHLTTQGRQGWHVVATVDGAHQIAFLLELTTP